MRSRYIVFALSIVSLFCLGADDGDFEMAVKAYEQGRDKLAEVYFLHFIEHEPLNSRIPEVTYYLIKIYDKRGDLLNIISYASSFLDNYVYDKHRKDVFDLLIKSLSQSEAYGIALEYIKEFDYLLDDYELLEHIGYGLFRQNRKELTEYVFSLCPQTDTIKIMRAELADDFSRKREFYEGVGGICGELYLMELLLEQGDTIEVYERFGSIDHRKVDDDVLYRYAKISRLFDERIFSYCIDRLRGLEKHKNKALLLEGIHTGYLNTVVRPGDEEECVLFAQLLEQDTISRTLPDSIKHETFITDSMTLEGVRLLRKEIGSAYYVDSLYCEFLLGNNDINEAYSIILQYLSYANTERYVRKIRALRYFNDGDYVNSAKDIILSQADEPELLFVLAQALSKIGKNSNYLYRQIIETSTDTLVTSKAKRQLIKLEFEHGRYDNVAEYSFDLVKDDTSLIRLYLYSLARVGRKKEADALSDRYLVYQDYKMANYYGEYLIEKKKYTRAGEYYDSLVHATEGHFFDVIHYNWALIPFLRGEIDTAFSRFKLYFSNRQAGREFYKAAFKMATIHYLKSQFDTAAYYYGLASEYDSLRHDALGNQLVCFKKSGDWEKVIESGRSILQNLSEGEKADTRFDIGYAYLRSGAARNAIEHLKFAAVAQPSPEFLYWLAEAYLTTGEFVKALYQYRKIVHLFPKDKMWTPTALYKTGIVFEFMNETNEAKRIYEKIIRERGVGDTWGIEAQKRLKEMK